MMSVDGRFVKISLLWNRNRLFFMSLVFAHLNHLIFLFVANFVSRLNVVERVVVSRLHFNDDSGAAAVLLREKFHEKFTNVFLCVFFVLGSCRFW